jgi:hypothetical protein
MESAAKATPQRNLVNMGVLLPLIYICGYPPTTNLDNISGVCAILGDHGSGIIAVESPTGWHW